MCQFTVKERNKNTELDRIIVIWTSQPGDYKGR